MQMAGVRLSPPAGDGYSSSSWSHEDESSVDDASAASAHIMEDVTITTFDGTIAVEDVFDIEKTPETPATEIMSSRAYQLEMLEQSCQRNVIVAMDTGSGKTQVAILRIKAELDKGLSGKIIWFLAPTVALCLQQAEAIQLQNPAASIKTLTGNDNLDAWAETTWYSVLDGANIIVSTFQVLLDALGHAFVKMDRLALLIIDEAHHATKNSPVSNIMSSFYHTNKKTGKAVPAILGLTASPIMQSDLAGIGKLEEKLDAHCITPTLHRDELLKCVNKPELSHCEYEFVEFPEHTDQMKKLREVYREVDITTDPAVHRLLNDGSERSLRDFRGVMMKYDTYSQNQLKGFWGRTKEVVRELGSWAVDHYIAKVIVEFLERVDKPSKDRTEVISDDKRYLAGILRKVDFIERPPIPADQSELSQKASILIRELLKAGDNVVGIVFVKERATVTIVSDLLKCYPEILAKYRIGTMVGTSNNHAKARNVYEFTKSTGLESLQDFRSGKINMLVATSVLEEGIDIPACNLVICFEPPANLKSFIQRRGRARMKQSKLVIICKRSPKGPRMWEALEEEMKEQYKDEKKRLRQLELLEDEAAGSLSFVVESTGARLDLNNAKQHLEHFCRVATQTEYVDCRPDYIIRRVSNEDCVFEEDEERVSMLTATVTLPPFLPPELRKATSSQAWKAQKNAIKEAAFHAYVALYKAGLVNEYLLPIKDAPSEERLPAKVEAPHHNPFIRVAKEWKETKQKWVYPLTFNDENGRLIGRYKAILPSWIHQPRAMKLYPEWGVEWEIEVGEGEKLSQIESETLKDHTSALIALQFGHRWVVEDRDHAIKLIACDAEVSRDQIGAIKFDPKQHKADMEYLVRDEEMRPFEYLGLLDSKPPKEEVQFPFKDYDEAPRDVPYLLLKKTTRRSDFLHPVKEDPNNHAASSKLYSSVLPMTWATVDAISKNFALFSRVIPCVEHELSVMLGATELYETILKPVGITNMDLVVEAISARGAVEPVDYERLEFLGDSILKYCVVVQACAQHVAWPEGFLSFFKDGLVSNSRLMDASTTAGVPGFILTKIFTGHKWRPTYADAPLQELMHQDRQLPTKTIADVIEALIGAAYQNGANADEGIEKTLSCLRIFLTGKGKKKVPWYDAKQARDRLFDHFADNAKLPDTMERLEELIGYSFQKKSVLIEAMTHASYAADSQGRSFERLEFLGDAVLEYIIVTKLFNAQPALPHSRMHMIKTAMVNGDFLAFVGLDHRLTRTETVADGEGGTETETTTLRLWRFMRHNAPAMGIEQLAMEQRFEDLREEINEALLHERNYPWALLARLHAKKFYSDLLEAVLGAVWVDSGSIEACEAVLRRFKLLDYLERILRDKIHVQHPKEELGKLAVAEEVNYKYYKQDGIDGEDGHCCIVFVGNREVGKAEGALSNLEARTKAAELAVKYLKGDKMDVD